MTERVQIEIEANDAASGVLRAITAQFGELGKVGSDAANMFKANSNFMSLYSKAMKDGSVSTEDLTKAQDAASLATGRFYEALAMLVINGLKESINATMEYAGSVRDLSLASGASAEEASRLIQVLDDYEITAQDITTATKFLTKNGLEPTIETIAQLADEYVKLNTPLERNQFIMENLGRGGMQWANALSQGGDKLRALNGTVDQNLVLTNANIQATEKYRTSLENLSGTWEGIKVQVGITAIPVLNDALTLFQMNMEQSTQSMGSFLANAIPFVGAWNTISNAIKMSNGETAESASKVAENLKTVSDSITSSAGAAAAAAPQYGELLSMMERLNGATEEQIKLAAYQDLKSKMQASGGGISDEEAKVLEKIGINLGIFDQKAADTAKSMEDLNKKMADAKITLEDYGKMLEDISNGTYVITVETQYTSTGNEPADYSNGAPNNYATGTGGQYVTVPPGYPNDSFMVGLSSGEKYAVQTGAAGGGDTYSSSNAVNNYYGNNTFVIQADGSQNIGGVIV